MDRWVWASEVRIATRGWERLGGVGWVDVDGLGKRQGARGKKQGARGKRQEARGKRQEARGKRQEARGKRQGARGKRQEARGKRQEARGKSDYSGSDAPAPPSSHHNTQNQEKQQQKRLRVETRDVCKLRDPPNNGQNWYYKTNPFF